jgi:hypothetical protein
MHEGKRCPSAKFHSGLVGNVTSVSASADGSATPREGEAEFGGWAAARPYWNRQNLMGVVEQAHNSLRT